MSKASGYLKQLLANLKVLRERAGLSESEIEERLILGPGWVRRFESGNTVPSIDMVLALLHEIKADLNQLLDGLPEPEASEVERTIFAEEHAPNLVINFRYANFDAKYTLVKSTLADYEAVVKTLRDGLARLAKADQSQSEAIKTASVAQMFLTATQCWRRSNSWLTISTWRRGSRPIRLMSS